MRCRLQSRARKGTGQHIAVAVAGDGSPGGLLVVSAAAVHHDAARAADQFGHGRQHLRAHVRLLLAGHRHVHVSL